MLPSAQTPEPPPCPSTRGPQAFPRTEYLRRLANVKAAMTRRDIRALLVNDPANITYLTGYTALSAYVPQGLIVDLEEEEPFFIVRKMDAPAAIYQTFLDRGRVLGYPEDLVANTTRNGFDVIVEHLAETGATKGRIGLEFGSISHAAINQLSAKLKADDCTGLITWLRLVKSDLEIDVMREAAAIADAAMLRAIEVIKPGVREADAAAEIYAQLARGANGKAGTNVAHLAICAGPRSGTSHITWADEAFRADTHVNIELGGVRHGYIGGPHADGYPRQTLRSAEAHPRGRGRWSRSGARRRAGGQHGRPGCRRASTPRRAGTGSTKNPAAAMPSASTGPK